ncbi:hypothetical protein ACFOEQ_07255 [Chryseobacterium arachidis]|uniref:hypothetical protein n=1 Tax=Chryseobacterium arachidis TaxID=1416778 RepID=UPI003623A3B5
MFKITLKKGFHVIDEINADLDGDSYPDKIYIASSQEEMMELQILIFKNNKGSFSLWAKNDSSPILGEKEYKKTVTKGNYFTLEYTRDLEDKYNIYNYLTFKLRDNNFILHKFSQETYDAKANKKLPIKAWNENNFGIINFNTTTYEFLDHLK